MLCSSQTRDFVPAGRHYLSQHPGKTTAGPSWGQLANAGEHGLPIVKALRDISLNDHSKETWEVRASPPGQDEADNGGSCEEELYVKEHTVIWTRNTLDGHAHIIKSFTMDTPVLEALWCSFLLPVESPQPSDNSPDLNKDNGTEEMRVQTGVCVVEAGSVSIYTSDGKDYTTALPFPVAKTWPIKNGLLFERATSQTSANLVKMPKREHPSPSLPVLFSMLHPLDEVTPVICHTGGSTITSKVSFVTESSQQIVFTSEQPSLVVIYDKMISAHSVWSLRMAKVEEVHAVFETTASDAFPSPRGCPSGSLGPHEAPPSGSLPVGHSASTFSRLTLSSQSPTSLSSPLRSRISSPLGMSRLHSPSLSKLTLSHSHQTTQSPLPSGLSNLHRTPSPSIKSSPLGAAGIMRTPLSMLASPSVDGANYEPNGEPIAPEICLDHLWTEPGSLARDGPLGCASKAFLISDLCDQQFLCYFVSYRYQLRCVKFEESNDKSQLIFGTLSLIQAKDALSLPNLKMLLVLEITGNLALYSGITKVTSIHIAGLPSPLTFQPTALSSNAPHKGSSTPHFSPLRVSTSSNRPSNIAPVTSSRPGSAVGVRLDEDAPCLSPVPAGFSDSLLDNSLTDDPHFRRGSLDHVPSFGGGFNGLLSSIRDQVDNRVTVVLHEGSMFRTTLPRLATSPIIQCCLGAIRQILPRDVAIQVLIQCFCSYNAPGSNNGQSEWTNFIKVLLGLMGYDVSKITLTNDNSADCSLSPVIAPKKPRVSDQGASEDWDYLLSSEHHGMVSRTLGPLIGLAEEGPSRQWDPNGMEKCEGDPPKINHSALLYPHVPSLMFALHLVYEECKLDSVLQVELQNLALLLLFLAKDLGCEMYVDLYCRDHPQLFVWTAQHPATLNQDDLNGMHRPSFLPQIAPSLTSWLGDLMSGRTPPPFPYLPDVNKKTLHIIAMYVALFSKEDLDNLSWAQFVHKISPAGHRTGDFEIELMKYFKAAKTSNKWERVVLFMAQIDWKPPDSVCCGLALPLLEAVHRCRHSPPSGWPQKAYTLLGREDLAQQTLLSNCQPGPMSPNREVTSHVKGLKEEEDGMEYLDKEVLKLRFSKDLRVQELRRLLQSSRPVRVAIQQKPEVSDHEFIEEQQRYLYSTCIRTMALPVGRGMFTMCTYHPVATETLPIPKLCLTGQAPPRNTTVDLSHIDTPPNMSHWPQFHNGVAAGLRIAHSSELKSSWILYNQGRGSGGGADPGQLTNEHAGFLLGLGLNGHLQKLATLSMHDYLIKSHEITSVGLLLGVAAGKRGTMDMATTKLLSIHLSAFLPPTSTELDVPHNIQVAAILGLGLVYQKTAHRHVAEVLLSEIGRPPGPEMENCSDRESYSLSAGLALGLVMLGKGDECLGLSDLGMADQLYHYMVGGQKRPLNGTYKERFKSPSYQIKEGDSVNVDVTAPGATLALGLMFFNTSNTAVAEWLVAPDTQILLDFVRPDFLMLRMISRGLIMWDSVHPSREWVNANIPEIVSKNAFNKVCAENDPDCDIDFETMSQSFCYIVAGSCFVLGLKFAGSANKQAFGCLYEMVRKLMSILPKSYLVEQAGKSTLENCIAVGVLCMAMVMAGTGDIHVFRLCRFLRSRVGHQSGTHVLFGSHLAIGMALGLLFLGGGRYSLSTSPESIAAMVVAFFPKFPIHSNDNRYHLQALRHLYVLAAEPRLLLPRDVDSGHPCYVPIKITFQSCEKYPSVSYKAMAPCLLPESRLISKIEILGPRYWPVTFKIGHNLDMLCNLLRGTGNLYVKQRAGHLSYAADPEGYHSVLSQSLSRDQPLPGRVIKSEDIKSFSSDPRILAFAEYFCSSGKEQEYNMIQFLSRVLYECVSHEKLEVLPIYIWLHQAVASLQRPQRCSPLALNQLRLMLQYYMQHKRSAVGEGSLSQELVSQEFLMSLQGMVDNHLQKWISDTGNASVTEYLSGKESALVQSQNCFLLASLLSWYYIPHPKTLAAMITSAEMNSFPQLCALLLPLGLQVPTILTLSTIIQRGTQSSTQSAGSASLFCS